MTVQRQQSNAQSAVGGGAPETLDAAFHRAVGFPLSRGADARLPPGTIQERAAEEAAFGRIAVDARGLTAGMRLHVLEAGRAVLSEWQKARAPFDQQLAPYRKSLDAVEHLLAEVEALDRTRASEEAELEHRLEADAVYTQIKDRYLRAEQRYNEKSAENAGRVPTLWGFRASYVVAIGCIGVAEWLINYDTFLLFTQVPAIAAGATIILGLLLAFAAHGHGTLLKQWANRFGSHRQPAQRFADWRLFALSSFGLAVVLAAAGGSRYAAVIRQLAGAHHPNLLGADAVIDIDPVRDVLISLLANVAAWAVGVFMAYVAHDPDPEYMEAAGERGAARSRYNRRRRRADAELESLRARAGKRAAEKQNAAASHSGEVEAERALLMRVREHEKSLITAVHSAVSSSAERYRDCLVQWAIMHQGQFALVRAVDGQTLSQYEYKNTPILIDADFVKGLV